MKGMIWASFENGQILSLHNSMNGNPKWARVAARFILLLLAIGFTASAYGQQRVALELVLAIDTSTSVDAREFSLQRQGLARAFIHPDVLRSIDTLGPDGLAVTVVQWAGKNSQVDAIGWTKVANANDALSLSVVISKMDRLASGFTDISGAIDHARSSIENNAFIGDRRAIDVSGDGTSDGNDPAAARDAAIARNITINGLVIYSEEYDLGDLARIDLWEHFQKRVIGGEGAFLMEADSFDDFSTAIRRKLAREIAGSKFARR